MKGYTPPSFLLGENGKPETRSTEVVAVVEHVPRAKVVNYERILNHLRIPTIRGHVNSSSECALRTPTQVVSSMRYPGRARTSVRTSLR